MPTPLQMYKQHVVLLESEIEQLQQDLAQAKQNIAKLVAIQQTQEKEKTDLRVENSSMSNQLRSAGLMPPDNPLSESSVLAERLP
ncbi:hypothetical protein WHX55_10990 [Pseudomonas fluorescens]|uniref:hypothetical protein n=1 Tax=Pseudomonas fluorescens TaxID=294 RepID=UPI0032445A88